MNGLLSPNTLMNRENLSATDSTSPLLNAFVRNLTECRAQKLKRANLCSDYCGEKKIAPDQIKPTHE